MGSSSSGVEQVSRRILRGSSWAFSGKVLSGIGSVAILGLLARLLAPEAMGAYMLGLSLVFFTSVFSRVGLEQGALRFIAEAGSSGRQRNVRRLIWASVAIVFFLGVLTALVLWISLRAWAKPLFGSQDLAEVAGVLAIWMVTTSLLGLAAEIFRGFYDIRMAVLSSGTIFGGLISVILQAVFFGVLLIGPGYAALTTVLFASIVANLISLFVAFVLLQRRLNTMDNKWERPVSLRQLWETSFPLWIGNISILLMNQADVWIIGAARPEEEVAAYGAASRLLKLVLMSQLVVNDVVAPLIAELYTKGERHRLEFALRVTATLAAIPSIPILAGFVLFGSEILSLAYGPFYHQAGPILVALSLGALVAVLTGPASYVLAMTGNGKLMMVITATMTLVALGFGLTVVGKYGAFGVAVGFACVQAVQQCMLLVGGKWKTRIWTCVAPGLTLRSLAKKLFT